MIARIWRGYTTIANAARYENLLKKKVFTSIGNKQVKGFFRIQLLKRKTDSRIEFTTIMWFENRESVQLFAEIDYELAHVLAKANSLLSSFDERSIHCELIHEIYYDL